MHFLSIQSIFFEPSDKQVCKIVVIEVAHQEMLTYGKDNHNI